MNRCGHRKAKEAVNQLSFLFLDFACGSIECICILRTAFLRTIGNVDGAHNDVHETLILTYILAFGACWIHETRAVITGT